MCSHAFDYGNTVPVKALAFAHFQLHTTSRNAVTQRSSRKNRVYCHRSAASPNKNKSLSLSLSRDRRRTAANANRKERQQQHATVCGAVGVPLMNACECAACQTTARNASMHDASKHGRCWRVAGMEQGVRAVGGGRVDGA